MPEITPPPVEESKLDELDKLMAAAESIEEFLIEQVRSSEPRTDVHSYVQWLQRKTTEALKK